LQVRNNYILLVGFCDRLVWHPIIDIREFYKGDLSMS